MTGPLPPGEPRREVSPRWFAVIGGVWLLVVLAGLGYGLAKPTPTDRDQTTVAAARPVVDEAAARIATAAAAAGAVVAVSGFERVESCAVTVFRDGERYRRSVVAIVAPGGEADLLARVAAALPREYRAVLRGGNRLTADAGYWVLITASVVSLGEVRFVADTGGNARLRFGGCRPRGGLDTADGPAAVPGDLVPDVLARLELPASATNNASVSCVDGGAVATVEARAGVYHGDLSRVLSPPPGAHVVVEEATLYAYRTATAQVAVRVREDATIVTATTLCHT